MNEIKYQKLSVADIQPDMLNNFNRYHKVTKSWRKQNCEWILVDNHYIENWDNAKKSSLSKEFEGVLEFGGFVFGAYDKHKLIGFCCLDGHLTGSKKQYLQVIHLQVSYEYRRRGIGKSLFKMCVDSARKCACTKLYISANSSEEAQAAYRAMGCTYAEEIIPELFEAEPFDVHMEYVLSNGK
jgi:ribosomal protein S18 acetylase RimI-like enzyme